MPKSFNKHKKTPFCAYFPQNSVLINFLLFWQSISLCQISKKKNKQTSEQIPNNTGFRRTEPRKISFYGMFLLPTKQGPQAIIYLMVVKR